MNDDYDAIDGRDASQNIPFRAKSAGRLLVKIRDDRILIIHLLVTFEKERTFRLSANTQSQTEPASFNLTKSIDPVGSIETGQNKMERG